MENAKGAQTPRADPDGQLAFRGLAQEPQRQRQQHERQPVHDAGGGVGRGTDRFRAPKIPRCPMLVKSQHTSVRPEIRVDKCW